MSQRGIQCAVPVADSTERIVLAHGEGGRLLRRFLRERIAPRFAPDAPWRFDDAATLSDLRGPLAFATDSFVVSPLFFPGGDIGRLAVHGTVNDLAVRGAIPRYLSLAMILEEGLPLATLDAILDSVAAAARECAVRIVAGDTKVVPRGAADGVFLNTAGVGELVDPVPPGPIALRPGDQILVSGPVGRHGIAILAAREHLAFDPPPTSDCASLLPAVNAIRHLAPSALRDATRGGVAAVLHEWAEESGLGITLEEARVPVSAEVRGACELLGIDPLHIANEGTMVVAMPAERAQAARDALHQLALCQQAEILGEVRSSRGVNAVTIRRGLGREQPLDDPQGAPLPRIC